MGFLQAIAAVSAEKAVAQIQELGRRPDIVITKLHRLQDGRTGTEAILRRPRPVAIHFLLSLRPDPVTGETDLKFLGECAGHDLGVAHEPVIPSQLSRALQPTAQCRGSKYPKVSKAAR